MGRLTAGTQRTRKAENLRTHYCVARMALFTSIVISVLNCIFTFFGGGFYSAFSFTFPQAMIDNARFWTGMMYSLEEYEQVYGMTQADFLHPDFMLVDGGLALIAIAVLVVCWVLSKRYVGWLIAATALLGADMLFEVYWYDISLSYLSEYLMPGCLLAVLIIGIAAHYRLKVMEWTSEDPAIEPGAFAQGDAVHLDTPALHAVDYSAKGKIIMIYDIEGYTVCYRRVGRINELIINKMVYDTIDAGRYEQPHELCAYIDGHEFAVGTTADARSYIRFDGKVVKKKTRWM